MSATVTVSAKIGPGITASTQTTSDATGILYLPDRQVLQVFTGADTNSPPAVIYDCAASTSIIMTISGKTVVATVL